MLTHLHQARFALPLLALLLFTGTASAQYYSQRTSPESCFVDASISTPFSSVGAAVGFGYYKIRGYFYGEFSGVNRKVSLTKTQTGADVGRMDYTHFLADGGYMYRIVSTRRRELNLYGGGGLILGWESIDMCGKRPNNGNYPVDYRNKFLYGIAPRICLEYWPFDAVGFTAGFRLPVNFSSKITMVNYELSVGARFSF